MKQTMYLIVWRAIQWDSEWKEIYERLIARKCRSDERTRRLVGREKVIGRLAGQITSVIYALLKKDQELLLRLAPRAKPPEPALYRSSITSTTSYGAISVFSGWRKTEPGASASCNLTHQQRDSI